MTRLIMFNMTRFGFIAQNNLKMEFKIPELPYLADLAIIPKSNKLDHKGIIIEVNGPTHYYAPDLSEMTCYSQKREDLIRAQGYKVFSF